MLVVNRKPATSAEREPESVVMIGNEIEVQILKSSGGNVTVGIRAPESYRILRAELVPDPGPAELVAA